MDMEIYGDAMMGSIVKPNIIDSQKHDSGLLAGREAIEAYERTLKAHRERLEERRRHEIERASQPYEVATSDGSIWTYVIVDGEFARIVRCKTKAERLEIPDELGGYPVIEIAADGCARLAGTREIICAASIESIGSSAFRNCGDLVRLVLPRNTSRFESSWVSQCNKLTDLVLPDMLATLEASVFEVERLETLTIGAATRQINPGAFAKSSLRKLQISPENPYFATDCTSVFSRDCSSYIAAALPCTNLTLPDGCASIAPKAFAACPQLEEIILPSTLEEIGAHAFATTSLRSFKAPAGLKHIGRRAFFRCQKLVNITLNEGLLEIGDEAFARSGIELLRIPASVHTLSQTITTGTKVVYSGTNPSFTIAPGSVLFLDEHGGLYQNELRDSKSRARKLICMMETSLRSYSVLPGTRSIGARAFAHMEHLENVMLPEGLLEVGEAAFRGCARLRHVTIPESLQSIGKEAFFETVLEGIYLPEKFMQLGALALVTRGAREDNGKPSLQKVQVSPNCERFYHTQGLLLERSEKGSSHVVLFDGTNESVVIPREVDTIAAYAFANASTLRELTISTRVEHIGAKGLSVNCLIEHLHIDIDPPIDGHAALDLHFPDTQRSRRELQMAFDLASFVSPEKILARYDASVVNMHDIDAKTASPLDVYGQATRIIARLEDPLYLSTHTKVMYEQILRSNLDEICVAVARHDDRSSMDSLVDLGFLNQETLIDAIEAVGRLQDAAMTGHLLEIKRRLFAGQAIDFDL